MPSPSLRPHYMGGMRSEGMNLPSCPNCGANLFWRGLRGDRVPGIEGRKWYEFAGYRQYCRRCGVQVRSRRKGLAIAVILLLLFANGFLHTAVAQNWGGAGLVALYAGWMLLMLVAWSLVRYERVG